MKKKIIFVTEALWIGGIESALINLLNAIDYDAYDVTLLVVRASLELIDDIHPSCRLIIADREKAYTFKEAYRFNRLSHLYEESEHPSRLHRMMMWSVPFIKWLETRLYIIYIARYMKEKVYDTAIIYSDREAELTVKAIKARRYLMFYHHGAMKKEYHDDIGYRQSEKVIVVSENRTEELKQFRPRYANKMMTLHNIIDINKILARSQEHCDRYFNRNDFNIVTCGRLSHVKGIDYAIEALSLLKQSGYTNLQWWIVGGGPEEDNLRHQIEEKGVADQFHLLGMKDNPYPYIAQADLYVQPSRFENYSIVILEAMVLCRPILATEAAASQQIQNHINGLLCDTDAKSLSRSISYLINNEKERLNYIQYLKSHSLDKENEAIMKKFYELL